VKKLFRAEILRFFEKFSKIILNFQKMTKICVSIAEKNPEKLFQKIEKATKSGADFLEIWLGEIENLDENLFKKIVEKAGKMPLLGNCKNQKERGNFAGDDAQKTEILIAASKFGFDFIDFDFEISDELLARFSAEKNPKTKLILSAHFWDGTPNLHHLLRVAEKMRAKNADILKFAATAKKSKEVISMMRLAEKCSAKKMPHIVISMGNLGKMTRFFAPLFKNEMTFAALDEKSATAPGQVSARVLRDFWEKNLRK